MTCAGHIHPEVSTSSTRHPLVRPFYAPNARPYQRHSKKRPRASLPKPWVISQNRQSFWQALHNAGFGIGQLQRGLLVRDHRPVRVSAHQMIWLHPRRHRVMFNVSPPESRAPSTGQAQPLRCAPEVNTIIRAHPHQRPSAICPLAFSTMALAARPSACTARRIAQPDPWLQSLPRGPQRAGGLVAL